MYKRSLQSGLYRLLTFTLLLAPLFLESGLELLLGPVGKRGLDRRACIVVPELARVDSFCPRDESLKQILYLIPNLKEAKR